MEAGGAHFDAFFDALRKAYGLAGCGARRPVSERVWHVPDTHARGGVAVKLYATEHAARAHKEAAVLVNPPSVSPSGRACVHV